MATTLASVAIYEQQTKSSMSISPSAKNPPQPVAVTLPESSKLPIAALPAVPGTGNADQVRVIDISEYKEAALCLAEAFKDDHTTHYFLNTPDSTLTEEQKWDVHVSMMEYLVYAHCMKGLVTTVGNYDAVALWMPPGKNLDDYYTIIRSGLWRLNFQLTREGRHRYFTEFIPLLTDSKAQVMGPRDNDSWYLVYVGTRSSARGKGCAKKLITHVTAMADAQGKACYLESSNDINPGIYRKYGFEIRKKVYLQRAEETVELDLMVREPVARKRDSFLEAEEGVEEARV